VTDYIHTQIHTCAHTDRPSMVTSVAVVGRITDAFSSATHKDTVVLKGECLQSDAFYRHSYYIGH